MPSHFPDDVFTSTEGFNYGLDGFPDLEYGAGVLDGQIFGTPEKRSVPDGVVVAVAEDYEGDMIEFSGLGNIASVVKEAALQDLSWLEMAGQDPERLPENPVALSIPELEQAWGTSRRTDGVSQTLVRDRVAAAYEQSLQEGQESPRQASDLGEVVLQGWRRLASGVPFGEVARDIASRLGADAPRVAKQIRRMKDDAGLIGRVFIRAAHYPKCATGKWSDHVRKASAGSRFVVAKDACAGCVRNVNGSCAVFAKKLVDQVPWEKAARVYAPELEASGRRVASGDPKESLRRAFAAQAQGLGQAGDFRPILPAADAGVDAERVAAEMSQALGRRVVEVTAAQAQERLAAWCKAGSLTEAQVARIAGAGLAPDAQVRLAARFVATTSTGSYSGIDNHGKAGRPVSRAAAQDALRQAEGLESRNQEIRAEASRREASASRAGRAAKKVEAKVAKIAAAIDKGVKGRPLKNLIRTTLTAAEVPLAAPLLDPLLRRTAALDETPDPRREYTGAAYRRAETAGPRGSGPAHGEVRRMLRWARQQMTEGEVGQTFDQMLSARWASSVLQAGAEELRALRAKHEGLAGHLYVDASAYATQEGVTGCENGGLKHRANQIPSVMQMGRCATCTRRTALADGQAFCQVYNKALVAKAPTEDRKAYQAEMLRLANGSDAERTAALFVAEHDGSFDLGGVSEMDHIVVADAPEDERLGEVLFGGFTL